MGPESEHQVSTSSRRPHGSRGSISLAITLFLLLSIGILATLGALTQAASAQAPTTGQKADRPPISSVSGAPDCASGWNVIPSPNHGPNGNNLDGISAVSANDIWAVGTYQSNTSPFAVQTLTEHWDGSAWSTVPSPNSGGSTYYNYLYGVAAVSANDVWAVGYYNNGTAARTLILHWDGTGWGLVSSPNHGSSSNELYGVTAVAANNVWAVGSYVNASNVGQTLVLHWDGSTWSTTTGANIGTQGNVLYGISAASASDIWAVGFYDNSNSPRRTLILHWDGSIWAAVSSPNVGTHNTYLTGVAALSGGNTWAVGYYDTNSGGQTVILRLNGNTWSIVPSPNPSTGESELNGVTAITPNDVWAVGYFRSNGNYFAMALHWDGSAWSSVYALSPGTFSSSLTGVDAVSANDVWTVGGYSSSVDRTLVEQYNPCTGSPTPTGTPGGPTATPIPSQCALQFEDVPNPSTFYQYVQCLVCRGIINGYACGGSGEPCNPTHDPYFRPNANVTRGQIAKIVALSANIHTPVSGQTFQDVPPGSTFYTYTEQLYALQVMNGYPCGNPEPCVPPANLPYFRPNSNATRGQLAKIDANAAGYQDPPSGHSFQDVPVGSTFYTYTQRLTSRGVMSGYTCGGTGEPCVPPGNLPYFRPNANVTRGQTSKIVANTFYPNCQAP